jgi:hypothetical protein
VAAESRRFGRGTALAIAVLVLVAGEGFAQRPAEEAIVPLADYKNAESRTLAQDHLSELRVLYDAVRRCTPEVDFHRHGLGFRRPLGLENVRPYLTIWVWLPNEPTPAGASVGARASDAFRVFGPRLLPHLVARSQIHGDDRVGGYGLVLTWTKQPAADPPIGETLVVFAPKPAVEPFVAGTSPITALLAQSRTRVFDGQTEVPDPRLSVSDQEAGAPATPC